MAEDERAAIRLRNALGPLDGLSEKRMMGGICFLLNGNMIGGADRTKEGRARFMFRIGKENHHQGEVTSPAEPMEIGGRVMRGLFFVDADHCDESLLQYWLALSLDFVKKLPPK